ncbi:hypothetical protein CLU79DRAFT_737582 [Phycomyces nitens]|nr:hypothetical protein CLU79DRAFT_737582 [Phycomyces nitens]
MILCSIMAGASALIFERVAIMVATSFTGSFLFFVGFDMVIHTGYLAGIKSVLDWNPQHQISYILNLATHILLLGTVAITCVSFMWQHTIGECRAFDGTWIPQKTVEFGKKFGT